MTDENHYAFIGRIVKDTILEKTPKTNVSMARFTIAVNRDFKNKDGKQTKVTYISSVIYDKWAESIAQYMKQGTLIHIEGYISTNEWTDESGKKKSKLIFVCKELQLLSNSNKNKENISEEQIEKYKNTDDEIENYNEEMKDFDNEIGLF